MNIVIMGSGRVGARLARLFDREGHDVTVIDLNPQAFERLDIDFKGRTIVGTGIDEDVLKKAGIADADVFLAVTNLDNPNIMASQIAKLMFKVPRVVARIYDPAREDTYHDLGLETICPTTLVAQRIHQAVVTNSDEPLDDHEIEPLPSELAQLARTINDVAPSGARPAPAEPARSAVPAVAPNPAPAVPLPAASPAPNVPAPPSAPMAGAQQPPTGNQGGPVAQQKTSSQANGLRRFFR